MPDPKPRRWLQIHLLTCVIMMFVAGALMWLNFKTISETIDVAFEGNYARQFSYDLRGWPLTFGVQAQLDLQIERETCDTQAHPLKRPKLRSAAEAIPINIAAAMAILVLAATVCEWPARRRERQP